MEEKQQQKQQQAFKHLNSKTFIVNSLFSSLPFIQSFFLHVFQVGRSEKTGEGEGEGCPPLVNLVSSQSLLHTIGATNPQKARNIRT